MAAGPDILDPTYRHRGKAARPGAPLTLGGCRIKWYDLEEPGWPVQPDTGGLARAHLAAHPPSAGDVAGFVILHRCGATFHFLLTALWRGNNELWQSVAHADPPSAGFAPFAPAYPPPGSPRPTFCVWELGIVAHEALAWQRLLHTARDTAALDRWQADLLHGPV